MFYGSGLQKLYIENWNSNSITNIYNFVNHDYDSMTLKLIYLPKYNEDEDNKYDLPKNGGISINLYGSSKDVCLNIPIDMLDIKSNIAICDYTYDDDINIGMI